MTPVSPELLAGWALAMLAVAPAALGGARLRGGAVPSREAWLAALEATRHSDAAWLKLPLHAPDEALDGGLDLVATLVAGRPVLRQGLLARAQGGYLVVQMAERLAPARAAHLAQAMDTMPLGKADTLSAATPAAAPATGGPYAGLCLLALDESDGPASGGDDRPLAESLQERLAFDITLPPGRPGPSSSGPAFERRQLQRARERWAQVTVSDEVLHTVVQAAAALGLMSVRAPLQALVACRVAAALRGAASVGDEDVVLAAQLVLAPRARQLPQAPAEEASAEDEADISSSPPSDDTPPDNTTPRDAQPESPQDAADTPPPRPDQAEAPLDDRVVAAALASMPAGLLAQLSRQPLSGPRRREAGRVGSTAASAQRGRPVGSQPGTPRGGSRLSLVDTLRAAAPWQRLRREQEATAALGREADRSSSPAADTPRVRVSRDDLRVQRRQQRSSTTTVFAIDASGSQAMHRLAEAKGAVELLLADCYARRDRVAVIGFRGTQAQVLLPPTRSLVLARRQLAGLPGGGGTPLALGIDAATALATAIRRQGSTPLLVMLTDGKGNINRQGEPGRAAAQADAESAARAWAAQGIPALVIDTSPQPGPAAPALAQRMQARCIALPHAGAQAVSAVVRAERGTATPGAARRVG
jgi:magnesium chelatase subunit D